MTANLDPYLWFQTDIYKPSFKAVALAWYRSHNLVKTHTDDAIARKMKRDAQRQQRKARKK